MVIINDRREMVYHAIYKNVKFITYKCNFLWILPQLTSAKTGTLSPAASKTALNKVTVDLGYKVNGTDVVISLADPGWCRTDLGGSRAPNAPESSIPGIVVGAFVDDGKSGRLFGAQDYAGMTLTEAITQAESVSSPYESDNTENQ